MVPFTQNVFKGVDKKNKGVDNGELWQRNGSILKLNLNYI